jgi:hypothetical protein
MPRATPLGVGLATERIRLFSCCGACAPTASSNASPTAAATPSPAQGLQDALLFTHAHDHLLRAGLAQVSDPSPPRKTKLHNAARAYQAAVDGLAQ